MKKFIALFIMLAFVSPVFAETVVVSDNPDKTIYKAKTINNANIDNFFLIGQVVGLYRDLSGV